MAVNFAFGYTTVLSDMAWGSGATFSFNIYYALTNPYIVLSARKSLGTTRVATVTRQAGVSFVIRSTPYFYNSRPPVGVARRTSPLRSIAAARTPSMTHPEVLKADGTVDMAWGSGAGINQANQTDRFTFRGDSKAETWTPAFTYHGASSIR